MEIGDLLTLHVYTDCYPYQVVQKVSDKQFIAVELEHDTDTAYEKTLKGYVPTGNDGHKKKIGHWCYKGIKNKCRLLSPTKGIKLPVTASIKITPKGVIADGQYEVSVGEAWFYNNPEI